MLAAAVAACGEKDKPAPGPADVARVGSSIGDIVFQCQSVAAGFVEEADRPQLTRDVNTLLGMLDRVSADAAFTAGAKPGPTRRTSLRGELRLARRTLMGCEPALAGRLDAALAE